jgi:hypothetical protein
MKKNIAIILLLLKQIRLAVAKKTIEQLEKEN